MRHLITLFLVGPVLLASAQAQTNEFVSENSSGILGNTNSVSNSKISDDGRWAVFSSDATNLVSGDTNGDRDIFRRDLWNGTTSRMVMGRFGLQPNGDSNNPDLSSDGQYLAFDSKATNLGPLDSNTYTDVYLRSSSGANSLVSVPWYGSGSANASSWEPSISGDGNYVAFSSQASNLTPSDGNGQFDVFVYDRQAGYNTTASVSSSGVAGNQGSDSPSISDDGRYVVFASNATNLVSGDTNGDRDIFLRDRQNGTTTRLSTGPSGQGNSDSFSPRISADGQWVVFTSYATNLITPSAPYQRNVYRVRRNGTQMELINRDTSGQPTAAGAFSPSVSGNGRYVTFISGDRYLVSPPHPGFWEDVFLYDSYDGTMEWLNPRWFGGETVNGASSDPKISSNGRTITFMSRAPDLLPGDTNNSNDVLAHLRGWAKFQSFGTGTQGSGKRVPSLSGAEGTCDPAGHSIRISNALGRSTAFLWVSPGQGSIPMFGGTVYLDLSAGFLSVRIKLGGVAGVAGTGKASLTGPDVHQFVGQPPIYMQALILDPGAIQGIALSNALSLQYVN